uniref:Uncharacterized protein n=1 Tax=Triticum urartu TaxID=4572 RepID=A0A8R7PCH8_TRIUA
SGGRAVGDSGWTRWSTGEERAIHPATPPEPRWLRLQWRCQSLLFLSLSPMPLFPSLIHRHSLVHLIESS